MSLAWSRLRSGRRGDVAQFFTDFGDTAVGASPESLTLYGPLAMSVVSDAAAANGKSLRITKNLGGDARGVYFNAFPSAPHGRVEFFLRLRSNATTLDLVPCSVSPGTLPRSVIEEDGVYIRDNFTTNLGSAPLVAPFAGFQNYRTCRDPALDFAAAKVWEVGSSEPGAWSASATTRNFDDGSAVPQLLFPVFTNSTNCWIDAVGIGTDGDPAPTAPIGPAERQRSRLILTPW